MNLSKTICPLLTIAALTLIPHPALAQAPYGTLHVAPHCDAPKCEPLIPNLKSFGFYQTKWRRWPEYRAAKYSPGRGARAEMIPTPAMEGELPAADQPSTLLPPLELDPLQPGSPTSPGDTIPGAESAPFDPLNLENFNDDDGLLLPPSDPGSPMEEIPEPQSSLRPTGATRYVRGGDPRSPWQAKPRRLTADQAVHPNLLRAPKEEAPRRVDQRMAVERTDRAVVPAANWSHSTSPQGLSNHNPLRVRPTTIDVPPSAPATIGRRNPLR